MRKITFLLSICLSLALGSQTLYADSVTPSDRVHNSLLVRPDPSTANTEVGHLAKGEMAELIESVPHWYYVRLSNGVEGYVHKSWSRVVTTSPTNNLEVHFVDVGQGDSTLVVCPNGNNILIDAGSSANGDPDAVRDYILGVLDRHERRVNNLVITHPDTDHYNMIENVTNNILVDHIYLTGQKDDYKSEFWKWLESKPSNIKTVLGSQYYDKADEPNPNIDCGSAQVYILASSVNDSFSRKNTMSVVMMIRYGSFEVVLTGDATKRTEAKIMERYDDDWLNSDVLKIGHHGSLATSTTDAWASTISPELAVVSAGYQSHHGHPRQEILERLDDYTTTAPRHPISSATGTRNNYDWHDDPNYTENIYSTASSGNVIVTSDGGGYSVTTRLHEE